MEYLPTECLNLLYEWLDGPEYLQLRLVSKKLHDSDTSQVLRIEDSGYQVLLLISDNGHVRGTVREKHYPTQRCYGKTWTMNKIRLFSLNVYEIDREVIESVHTISVHDNGYIDYSVRLSRYDI